MTIYQAVQRSFNGGEVSPWMYGRADDQKYSLSLALCRNFIPTPHGPVENRPGFQFVREAKSSTSRSRLIPFIFSDSQAMVLEFSEKCIRFHAQGGTLSKDGQPYEVATPYASSDLFSLHYCQNADILTIVHPSYRPMELKRYSLYDWRLEPVSFSPPCDPPTGLSGSFSCGDPNATDAQKKAYVIRYVVTAIVDNDGTARESEASSSCAVTGNIYLGSSSITLSWNSVAGAARYRVYKTYSGIYGYIGETTTPGFVDTNIAGDESITPPKYDDAFRMDRGISAATVVSGGSGYKVYTSGIADQGGALNFTYKYLAGGFYVKTEKSARLYCYAENTNTGPLYGEPSEVDYPDYPSISPKQLPIVWVDDLAGVGVGASVEPIWEETKTRETGQKVERVSPDAGERTWPTKTSRVTMTLVGYRVTSRGNNYSSPRIRVKYAMSLKAVDVSGMPINDLKAGEAALSIGTVSVGVQLAVSDSTGSGAELQPVVTNGVITGVNIVHGGSNYTSPTCSIIARDGGTGAQINLTVAAVGDYPGAVSYFEQRRCFAGTRERPQYVWMTRPGTESDMTYTLPSQSDNRVKFKISSSEISRIKHMIPLSYLMLMTPTAEYRTITANDDAITPASIGVRAFSYIGASDVTPCIVNNNAIYEAALGGHVRELTYVYQSGGYISGDVSIRANHLFDGKSIRDMAYCKAPFPVVWCVSSDGSLLSLTYIPEQQVGAWAKHTTDGVFESCCVVNEDGYDALYAVVVREINGEKRRYIERMADRQTDGQRAFFVDSGLTYSGDAVTTLSGLDHLEGKTVSILADGAVMPQQVVKDGKVSLQAPSRLVSVGLPYESEIQTLPLVVEPQDGRIRGRRFNSGSFSLEVYQSSAIFVGTDEGSLSEAKQRTTESPGTPPRLLSTTVEGRAYGDWSGTGQVVVVQRQPLPLTICSLIREVDIT